MKIDLNKLLAKTASDIALLADTVADATLLFAEGKIKQLDLTQAINDHKDLIAIHASLLTQLEAEKARDVVADHEAQIAAKDAAAAEATALLAERADCAADLDSAISSLINTSLRLEALNERVNDAAYDAGARAGSRLHHLTLRPVGAVLAARLSRSGLSEKFVFVHTPGVQESSLQTVSALIDTANGKLMSLLKHARAQDAH